MVAIFAVLQLNTGSVAHHKNEELTGRKLREMKARCYVLNDF